MNKLLGSWGIALAVVGLLLGLALGQRQAVAQSGGVEAIDALATQAALDALATRSAIDAAGNAAAAQAAAARASYRATQQAAGLQAQRASQQATVNAALMQATVEAAATRQAQEAAAASQAMSAQATRDALDAKAALTRQAQKSAATGQAMSAQATRDALDAEATRAAYAIALTETRRRSDLGTALLYLAGALGLIGTACTLLAWVRRLLIPHPKTAVGAVIDVTPLPMLPPGPAQMPKVRKIDDPRVVEAMERWWSTGNE